MINSTTYGFLLLEIRRIKLYIHLRCVFFDVIGRTFDGGGSHSWHCVVN